MATIKFTQCLRNFKLDRDSIDALYMPVILRMRFYRWLLKEKPNSYFSTMDENFILVAQWMKRTGLLKDLTLVAVCACGKEEPEDVVVATDGEGDMLSDIPHGFFPQRLEYLR